MSERRSLERVLELLPTVNDTTKSGGHLIFLIAKTMLLHGPDKVVENIKQVLLECSSHHPSEYMRQLAEDTLYHLSTKEEKKDE
jgi:hypothetical protein